MGDWWVFLRGLFGLPLKGEDLALFTRCTGRTTAPSEPASEAWLACGRRSGKTFMLCLIAVYLATFKDWTPYLAPGEVGTIMVIATDASRPGLHAVYRRFLNSPVVGGNGEQQRTNKDDLASRSRGG